MDMISFTPKEVFFFFGGGGDKLMFPNTYRKSQILLHYAIRIMCSVKQNYR